MTAHKWTITTKSLMPCVSAIVAESPRHVWTLIHDEDSAQALFVARPWPGLLDPIASPHEPRHPPLDVGVSSHESLGPPSILRGCYVPCSQSEALKLPHLPSTRAPGDASALERARKFPWTGVSARTAMPRTSPPPQQRETDPPQGLCGSILLATAPPCRAPERLSLGLSSAARHAKHSRERAPLGTSSLAVCSCEVSCSTRAAYLQR